MNLTYLPLNRRALSRLHDELIEYYRTPEETDEALEGFVQTLFTLVRSGKILGNLVQSGVFHPQAMIEMEDPIQSLYQMHLNLHGVNFWTDLYFYADCEHILKVLEPTGVLDRVRAEYSLNITSY